MKNWNYEKNGIGLFVRTTIPLFLLVAAVLTSCDKDDEMQPWEMEVQQLKAAIKRFKDIEVAKAEGYEVDVTGYRTGMGHHFLKATLLDGTFEVTRPEVLLYAPDENGKMQFVAVEYATPIEDLDNPPPAPEGFTGNEDVWEVNTEFSLWTLHVWVVMENPEGIFAPRNPKIGADALADRNDRPRGPGAILEEQ